MANQETIRLFGLVLGILLVASGVGFMLRQKIADESFETIVNNLNARIRAWWVMSALFAFGLLSGRQGAVVLFGLTSFLALREFMTLTPTRLADHWLMLLCFFVITPLQYLLVAIAWYDLLYLLIPVCAFLLLPTLSAIAGDCEGFLERTAKIQWGLTICVYCVSYAPALLMLKIPGYEGRNANLLFFFVLVTQISDVLQYVWGKCLGKTRISPTVSPNKTWEGFIGGSACATLIGLCLWWATPFRPWQAAAMSLALTISGFAGGMTMSAIKRDRGVKDYGNLIEGHGGMLDRIDSICFAAPIFFHLTRYFFT